MTQDQSEQLLDLFACTVEASERVRALTDLMTVKAIPKRADDPRFTLGLDNWVETANSLDTSPQERLLAVAELIRATQQIKKRQPELIARLAPLLRSPLPPLSLLDDAEARLNVARACSIAECQWLQAYRASSLASETAPKPRAELMDGMVARASSISEVLDLLTEAFDGIRPETETPADSLSKRVAKTLDAFRTTVLSSRLDAGADVGKKLDRFIRSAFIATGRPQNEDVQIELTREVALALHDLVRSRFSLATEPETFSVLQYCRGFFSGISWPREVHGVMDLLIKDISEALVMLGRMGVPNQDLLSRLEIVCGIKERAKAVATQLADQHPEIDEPIRNWLRVGRMTSTIATSQVLEQSLLSSMDEAIGVALMEARAFHAASDFDQRIANSLEIFDPALVPAYKSVTSQSVAMFKAIEELAKRRDLALLGTVGEELEFSPKHFDAHGPLQSTKVIVRRPAIVKVTAHGSVGNVVKKGLVE